MVSAGISDIAGQTSLLHELMISPTAKTSTIIAAARFIMHNLNSDYVVQI
jgi:hypothetical protein